MDRLWAPWRIGYVQKEHKNKSACIFCEKIRAHAKHDAENYVVIRRKHACVVLNIYPYNNGHLMIVPRRHVSELGKLRNAELLEVMTLLNDTKEALERIMKPHGFNIGINYGHVAGAGIADHCHIHIVPRWTGDTNFMPVFSDTKVIPDSLDALYERMVKIMRKP